jgi:hypothetical protein
MAYFEYVCIENQAIRRSGGKEFYTATGKVLRDLTYRVYDETTYKTKTYLNLSRRRIPMIAQRIVGEGRKDIYIDYITGKRLNMSSDNYNCHISGEGFRSDKIIFMGTGTIKADDVKDILHSLSSNDVYEYAEAFNNLEYAIRNAYLQDRNFRDDDENFMDNFRKKYWK